jgi:hypothetical protein
MRYQAAISRFGARIGNFARWVSLEQGVSPWLVPTWSLGEDRSDWERRVFRAGQTQLGVAGTWSAVGIMHPQRELELLGVAIATDVATLPVGMVTAAGEFQFEVASIDLTSAGQVNTDPALGAASGAALRFGRRNVSTFPTIVVGQLSSWWPLGILLPPNRLFYVQADTLAADLTIQFAWRELGP